MQILPRPRSSTEGIQNGRASAYRTSAKSHGLQVSCRHVQWSRVQASSGTGIVRLDYQLLFIGVTDTPDLMSSMAFVLETGSFDALIFDCDGTLVDSSALYLHALQRVFKEHGLEMGSEWYLARTGLTPVDLMFAYLE